jgi:quinate dehydrogenase (quinone)
VSNTVQPRSVEMPQIGNQTLTESDMWGATPFDQLMCRINFKSMRYEGLFTAPGTDVSLSFPGSLGGMNWGSIAFDPTHRYMFVNDMRLVYGFNSLNKHLKILRFRRMVVKK